MSTLKHYFNNYYYRFAKTDFSQLMQQRIMKILLFCSNYTSFSLQYDGELESKLRDDYTFFKINNPPRIFQAGDIENALKIIDSNKIDLIIVIPNSDVIDLIIDKFQAQCCNIPIVLLSHFNSALNLNINKIFEYSFCWKGNTELLLAIVKLIEDKLNAHNDIGEYSSQAILMIDDSPFYYSSFLPLFYKIIFSQLTSSNLHYDNYKMRGRPKLLLATNYEDAENYYKLYGENLLGIITDGTFSKNGIEYIDAGEQFIKLVRQQKQELPILYLTNNIVDKQKIDNYNIRYISKSDDLFEMKIKSFFLKKLAFGAFEFKSQKEGKIITSANNIEQLLIAIKNVPDESILYHSQRNSFTRWFKAKAYFQLAALTEQLKSSDFKSVEQIKDFLLSNIDAYLSFLHEGNIDKLGTNTSLGTVHFSRIGTGSIGGKARGLAFFDKIISENKNNFIKENMLVAIPDSLFIAADIFDEFINLNNIAVDNLSEMSDSEIENIFQNSILPYSVIEAINRFIINKSKPIVVRSSSVLEDSYYRSFAGVYDSYFIQNDNLEIFKNQIVSAIKSVYASVYKNAARIYFNAIPGILEKERMAIIVQMATGEDSGSYYFPFLSGVARSCNIYPFPPESRTDSIGQIVAGYCDFLTKGKNGLRFSINNPDKCLQLNSVESILNSTQKEITVLKKNSHSYFENLNDIQLRNISDIEGLNFAFSKYDIENNMIYDGSYFEGKNVITFSSILKHNQLPLIQLLNEIIHFGKQEFNSEVEIEFSAEYDSANKIAVLYLLQIRPFSVSQKYGIVNISNLDISSAIVKSNKTMGHGIYDKVDYILYIDLKKQDSESFIKIADQIRQFNNKCIENNNSYILIAPGRWGSSDANLGCPVKWNDISCAKALVEVSLPGFSIEPSFGSHFFHNIANLNIGYFTCDISTENQDLSISQLSKLANNIYDEKLFCISNENKFTIMIDSSKSLGIIKMN